MGYLRLLRGGPVLGLWLSETFSVFGDRFFTVALTWLAWQRSGAVAMGLVVVTESVPHLLIGAFGRRLVAWFASFRRLAFLEAAQVLVVAGLPFLWHAIGVTAVFVVIALIGMADAITGPVLAGLVPDLVADGQVRQVTGLMDLTGRLTWVIGPGAAGLLLAAMPADGLFLVDGVTFAVSAAAFGLLGKVPLHRASRMSGTPLPSWEAPSARRVLRTHRRLSGAIALGGVGEFCQTVFTIGIPIWLTVRLHAGLASYGLVISMAGAGSLLGNLVTGHVRLPGRFPAGYCLVWAGRGLGLAAFAFTLDLGQVLAVTLMCSVLAPVTSIALGTEVAGLPKGERLRVSAVNLTGLHIAGLTSMLLVPPLLVHAPGTGFALAGAVTAMAGLLAWIAAMTPAVRQRRRPAQEYART